MKDKGTMQKKLDFQKPAAKKDFLLSTCY